MNSDFWTKFGLIFSLVPFLILFVQYVVLTKWEKEKTGTGRALAYLISAGFITACVSVVRSFFRDNIPLLYGGTAVRILVGIALWNLVRILWRARREAEKERSS